MCCAGCTAISIKRHAEALKGILDNAMVAIHYILGGNALFLSLNGNGYTMLITTANEEYLLAFESEVASVDISRYIYASQVTNMHGTIGVGQGGSDKGSLKLFIHLSMSLWFETQS